MIRLARPPGAYITMKRKISPTYNSQAMDSSDSKTSASTSRAAPMMGPKKKVAPPRNVNSNRLPERTPLTTSAVTISELMAANPPPMPAKKPAMMKA